MQTRSTVDHLITFVRAASIVKKYRGSSTQAAIMPSRWAIITGVSAGGMGEGYVNAFVERDINVIATAIDIELLKRIRVTNSRHEASVAHLQLDVTSPESITAAVKQVESITGGRLDFLMST